MTAQPRFFNVQINAPETGESTALRATALSELVSLAAITELADDALSLKFGDASREAMIAALKEIRHCARIAARDAIANLKPKEPR